MSRRAKHEMFDFKINNGAINRAQKPIRSLRNCHCHCRFVNTVFKVRAKRRFDCTRSGKIFAQSFQLDLLRVLFVT